MKKTIITPAGCRHFEMTAQEVSAREEDEKRTKEKQAEEALKPKPKTLEQRVAVLETKLNIGE